MSDEEFQTGDAGSSSTYPIQVCIIYLCFLCSLEAQRVFSWFLRMSGGIIVGTHSHRSQ